MLWEHNGGITASQIFLDLGGFIDNTFRGWNYDLVGRQNGRILRGGEG